MSTTGVPTQPDASARLAKKPYARQMTEKRREQNRRSQKLFRENMKKKMDQLEQQLQAQVKAQEPSTSPELVVLPEVTHNPRNRTLPDSRTLSKLNVIDLNDAFAAAGDLAIPADPSLPKIELSFRSRTNEPVSAASSGTTDRACSFEDEGVPTYLAADVFVPPDPSSPDMRSLWPIPARAYWETYHPPRSSVSARKPITFSTLMTAPSSRFSLFGSSRASSINSPTGIPSPYLNHLLLTGESALNATCVLATAIGISWPAYINDHPSPFTTSPGQPPHFNYAAIPKALRPTSQQLSLVHPGYLDCIVFPKFRSNAITLSARGELDHSSFFLDLMHDGLVCWGNSNAAGLDMRDGVAWSQRSWEARPWFLRKWGWLIKMDTEAPGMPTDDEGEDDEDGMYEGSRWWRSIRGEDVDEAEVNEEEVELGEVHSKHTTCNVAIRDMNEFREIGVVWDGDWCPAGHL